MFLHFNTSLQLYMWHVLVRDDTLNTIWIVQVCDEFSQKLLNSGKTKNSSAEEIKIAHERATGQ